NVNIIVDDENSRLEEAISGEAPEQRVAVHIASSQYSRRSETMWAIQEKPSIAREGGSVLGIESPDDRARLTVKDRVSKVADVEASVIQRGSFASTSGTTWSVVPNLRARGGIELVNVWT